MKRLIVLSAVLFSFAFVSQARAKSLADVTLSTSHDDQFSRPSRRTLRMEAHRPIARRPGLRTVKDTPLRGIYRNPTIGISMSYPEDWEFLDHSESSPPLTLVAMFLSPSQDRDDMRQNVNLVIEDLPSPLTLSQYTVLGIAAEREFFEDYELLSSRQTRLAGAWPAHEVVFTASGEGQPMTFVQIWSIFGTKAHVWTFADSSESFAANRAVFERMLDSMTMK